MSEAIEQTESTPETPTMDLVEAAKIVFATPEEAIAEKPVDEKAAAAPEEPKPEEPPVDDKVSKKIAVALKAERAASQARQELRAKEQEIERREAALKSSEARFKLLEEDPVKAFEELKLDPKTFLEKLAGEHKPENVQAKEIAALKAKIEALESERTKEVETAKQREMRQQIEASWTEASRGFIEHVQATAEKFPHLVAEYTEADAIAAAERALLEVVVDEHGQQMTRADAYFNKFGEYPDNDVIAEHLDLLAKQRAEARQNSAWAKRGQSPTNGSQPLSNGDPNPKAPPVTKGSSPRTLTSRAASEKASPPKEMTDEERDALSIRLLTKAMTG